MIIAMVAGEPSGDRLGAGLIQVLAKQLPAARFEGVGGEQMIAAGFHSIAPLETLSVMGLTEVLRSLPSIWSLRQRLLHRYRQQPPAVFIGIDAPDFNLGLERHLRAGGIPTVHYVSPSVWAWRPWRVRGIARSVDRILTLLPFEAAFYQQHGVPVSYVGHPLADRLQRHQVTIAEDLAVWARQGEAIVALLPGSRMTELRRLGPLFLETARWLSARQPALRFVIPAATPAIYRYLHDELVVAGLANIRVLHGQAEAALAVSQAALVASGTATLEALLLECPMVVAYQVAPLTARLARPLLRVKYFALPNLLAATPLVPEFIQEQATVESLGTAILQLLEDDRIRETQRAGLATIRQRLAIGADQQAAAAVLEILANCPRRNPGVTQE